MVGVQSVLCVNMLGQFTIETKNQFRSYHSRAYKNWLLIAYLILNNDRVVPRKELIALFKESSHSTDANRMLRNRLFRIKNNLQDLSDELGQDLLLIYHDGCQWNPNIYVEFDTDIFLGLCQKAILAEGEAKFELKSKASELYSSGFLPMFREPWLKQSQQKYEAYLRLI